MYNAKSAFASDAAVRKSSGTYTQVPRPRHHSVKLVLAVVSHRVGIKQQKTYQHGYKLVLLNVSTTAKIFLWLYLSMPLYCLGVCIHDL